jgi:hypothetical protein
MGRREHGEQLHHTLIQVFFYKVKRKFFYSDLLMNSLFPPQQIIRNFEFEKIFAACDNRFIVYCCILFIYSCKFPYPL